MGRKLISGLLAVILIISFVLTVRATNVQEANDRKQELEQQKEDVQSEKISAAARVSELSASMKQAEADLEEKQTEIEEAEQDLLMAKIEESTQYESMKMRIKYMYENGNTSYMEIFLESNSIADFFSRVEYVATLSEYDRNKLKEFQQVVKAVEEKEQVLQAEYEELSEIQASLAAQREEAETILAEKSSELASIESELSEVKAQIQRAQEEEKKKQEAEEAKKQQQAQASKPSSGSSSSSSSSSSGQVNSPPVVSGNGYFTHPCPGMSYQSSYFGEIRYGIGDTTPHKGHDYAAPEGTPIYAAAAGEVVIAGYSYSAGYWVVINHGNGLVSKYMHMYQQPLVSAGDQVAKGQQIGGVGTTGQSTGNHLHFQVEVNGAAVNPSNYM